MKYWKFFKLVPLQFIALTYTIVSALINYLCVTSKGFRLPIALQNGKMATRSDFHSRWTHIGRLMMMSHFSKFGLGLLTNSRKIAQAGPTSSPKLSRSNGAYASLSL